MIHVYQHQDAEEKCKDYRILVNGQEAEPDTARVSAVCFNRRWPGHQRPIDQTELVNFLSMASDEPVHFTVTVGFDFDSALLRPLEAGITPEIDGRTVSFTVDKPGFYTLEPMGRNKALHLFIDAPKTYGVSENEHVLYFGPGVYEAGVIRLASDTTLFIDEGALVYGSVISEDAKNVRVIGHGILDNSHNHETILYPVEDSENRDAVPNAKRTAAMFFRYCENVTVDGITIRDSLLYHVRPVACENVTIRNTKVIGSWRYNSDGFDTHNCKNVLIEDCFVRTYDDCICVKGFDYAMNESDMVHAGKTHDTCEHYLIRRCTLWNDWGRCLEIGAETRAEEIFDIRFEDCRILHVTAPVLDCQSVDYADTHDIAYENISVEFDDVIPYCKLQKTDNDVYTPTDPAYVPPLFESAVIYHPEYSHGGGRRGINRDIVVRDVRVYGKQPIILSFIGFDEAHQTKNVTVSRLTRNGHKADNVSVKKNEFTANITIEE